eukprot:m.95059 g.95059  ORF g.95059 m.95059 type:complete len:161 (-) comp15010_c0_seq13:655-1137(-)
MTSAFALEFVEKVNAQCSTAVQTCMADASSYDVAAVAAQQPLAPSQLHVTETIIEACDAKQDGPINFLSPDEESHMPISKRARRYPVAVSRADTYESSGSQLKGLRGQQRVKAMASLTDEERKREANLTCALPHADCWHDQGSPSPQATDAGLSSGVSGA